ncbi:ankyrin repeat-containing domain protein [Tribonema minus]|uniref:Ankyrin repeat-containing domain protein n=1 Tax=Tribonema minus TaxID=303371 RepID=A0A835Z893_9STRA|nr:ankyrin repeat-containing domain protein [Tribonema minus]
MHAAASQNTSRLTAERHLLRAVEDNDGARVTELLQRYSDLDAEDVYHHTALMLAVQEGFTGIVSTLLRHNGEERVEAVDEDGLTPLMFACVPDRVRLIPKLLRHGSDPVARDSDGLTALMRAAYAGHVTVISALLKDASAQQQVMAMSDDESFVTPLLIAESEGHTEAVRELLTCSPQVQLTYRSPSGATPLMVAVDGRHSNNHEILMVLILAGLPLQQLVDFESPAVSATMSAGSYNYGLHVITETLQRLQSYNSYAEYASGARRGGGFRGRRSRSLGR